MKSSSLRFAAPLVVAGVTASLLVFAATGCGSGDGSTSVPTIPSTAPVVAYLGRAYTSHVALASGETGNLSLQVSTNNTASGTLEIVDPSRKASAKSRLVIATPFLSGTFDPATGAINLTGSYVGANGQTIPISIMGTLPTPPSTAGGSLTVTVNGQSVTSTFGGGSGTVSPTPSPSASPSAAPSGTPSPSPSASPTPAPSPSGTPAPVSGQNFSAQISSPTGDYNGSKAAFNAPEYACSVFVGSSAQVTPSYVQARPDGSSDAQVQFTLATPGATKDAPLAPGTYVIGASGGLVATAFYNEGQEKGWKAASGEVVVDSVSGTIASFRFVNLRMAPSRAFGSTTSQGSFTISGNGNARFPCVNADNCK